MVHWRSELRELLAPTLRLKPVWTRLVGLEVPDLANFHCSGNSAHTFQVENMGLVQASLQSCVLTCTRDAGFVIMFTLKTRRIMCSSNAGRGAPGLDLAAELDPIDRPNSKSHACPSGIYWLPVEAYMYQLYPFPTCRNVFHR